MGKFRTSTTDKCLLLLVFRMHRDARMKVRCTDQGHKMKEISMSSGVKQDCAVPPARFNVHINSLMASLSSLDFHPPTLA